MSEEDKTQDLIDYECTGGRGMESFAGKDISGKIKIPSTGSSKTFKTITVSDLFITRGFHTLTLYMDSGSIEIDRVKFAAYSNEIWIETESAANQPGFKPSLVILDKLASGGRCIMLFSGTDTNPPEDGIAAYTFDAGGDVKIWFLLNAPTPKSDSLF